jgi:3-methyladenine DNA glycosylase AlkD
MTATAEELQQRLRTLGSPEAAALAARYFKTGPGQYGAGDIFLGIRVPDLRRLAQQHHTLPLVEAEKLLRSGVHEDRSLALLILVETAARGDAALKEQIFDLYLANTRHVNNWDLVDVSAPQLVGAYLEGRDRKPLDRLAGSNSLWERRIAVLATLHFIRHGDFADTLRIAERLLTDREDLIHKAVGWMLREVGKRDEAALEGFLRRHARAMPRTMLRYAIERFPEAQRRAYLKGKFDG